MSFWKWSQLPEGQGDRVGHRARASTTDPIDDDVAEWAVVTAYVGGRSLEKIARKRAAITLPAVD